MLASYFSVGAMLSSVIGLAVAGVAAEPGKSTSAPSRLPIEGEIPSLKGATEWINSPPLTSASLRGKVVLVDFWTYTCINWLRTLPYVRAWAAKYKDQGLVVIGVHSPEFPFEGDIDNVRRAATRLMVDYPIAVDSDHAVWRAFQNHYWPALYFVDAKGRIRHHHFGEGEYERSEQVIQQLLAEAGARDAGGRALSARRRARARGRRRLAQPQVPRELRRLRTHRELRLPRRRSARTAARLRRTDAVAAQSVGAVGRLDGRSQGDRAPHSRRADRVSLPRPRPPSRHGPCGARSARSVPRADRRTAAGACSRRRRRRRGQRNGRRSSGCINSSGNRARSQDREFEIEFLDPGVEAFAFTFG